MAQLPTIRCYGEYGKNYGNNALRVDIGPLTLWYSYQTIIAFQVLGSKRYVTQNVWSSTTGKHLNWIDGGDKKSRLPGPEFKQKLSDALKEMGLDA